jgi:para-nitrobenzyl esterase
MRNLLTLIAVAACGHSSSDSPPPDAAPDAAPVCIASTGAAAERVSTTSGVVHGAMAGTTWAYENIPYAAPPVGDLRLTPPQPAACASAEIDATQLGPQCPQLADDGSFIGSEDCLQLNVWAPAAAAAPRPVMVWIHGGGNIQGSAALPLYDGEQLAEVGDVVIVSINYRLGQLGFLAHSALAQESPSGGSGNFGLLDQIAALHWVQANVAAFGGDPANVTIFGESAGGRDVCALVTTPGSAGLFHRAIVESGSCQALPDLATAEAQGAMVATALGCTGDVPSCLRAVDAQTLIQTLPGDASPLQSSTYQPTIDGVVLPAEPQATIDLGQQHQVEFLIGANADETGGVAPAIPDDAAYRAAIAQTFGPFANRVLAEYPSTDFPTPRAAFIRATTDARFVCPSREIARSVAEHQSKATYRYFFQYTDSPKGAVHGFDVPFVFGTFSAILVDQTPYQPTPTDLAVSAAVQSAWTSFARTGDPGGGWPVYDPVTDSTRTIDQPFGVLDGVRTSECDFWQPFYKAH